MPKPLVSHEESTLPYLNTSSSLKLRGNTGNAVGSAMDILNRFNPRLIGFGIVGIPVPDRKVSEPSSNNVTAVGIFFGGNQEEQK
jgi:hypothetical protein